MMTSRRAFLALLPVALVVRPVAAMRARTADPDTHSLRSRLRDDRGLRDPKHPTPRPGITAAKVVPDAKLKDKSAAAVFAKVREIPQVVDGIRCHCGCAEMEGFYSLLSCYEQGGMAQHCVICQGQAKLAYRLHKEGWSLNGIRKAIDAEFGD
jgi:hypothetical protein